MTKRALAAIFFAHDDAITVYCTQHTGHTTVTLDTRCRLDRHVPTQRPNEMLWALESSFQPGAGHLKGVGPGDRLLMIQRS